MNKTASEAVSFIRELLKLLPASPYPEVVVAPPFTALESVRTVLGSSSVISLGAQNLHEEPQGAFTGEISGPMLRDLGCRYVIIGHSERRTLFGERDTDVRKKLGAALAHGLRPILCVGESLKEREAGGTESLVTTQVQAGLAELTSGELATIAIAYEPIWAIGTGRAATVEQAVEVHQAIRRCLQSTWDKSTADTTRILYGGSVTPQNAESLLAAEGIDGALVGGACLKPNSFAMIISASRESSAH
jgi:triosephosphate isomerase